MFLKEFSDVMTRNFLVFVAVLDTPHEMLKEYAKECKIKPNLDEIRAEAQNIALIFDKENDKFKERILDLIEGANIKFYLEISMILNTNPYEPKNIFVHEILRERLGFSEEIFALCDNWAQNMSFLSASARKAVLD